jgi:thioredoxin reductase (NADPH)
MNQRGYIKTNDQMETNIEGIYAVGDVREKALRQVSTAVGDGAIAAVTAEHYLAETEYYHQLLHGERPCLLYVWEPTDEKCRCLLPEVEKIKSRYQANLTVSNIDVYKSASLIEKVCEAAPKTLPALVLVKDGKAVKTVCEEISSQTLDECARKLINN